MNILLNELANTTNPLRVSCNDGYVEINPLTLNFTYEGRFGRLVNNHILQHKASKDIRKKLVILLSHMDIYSKNVGGISITSN